MTSNNSKEELGVRKSMCQKGGSQEKKDVEQIGINLQKSDMKGRTVFRILCHSKNLLMQQYIFSSINMDIHCITVDKRAQGK